MKKNEKSYRMSNKANYTDQERAEMSERRREIAALDEGGWKERWGMVTEEIQRRHKGTLEKIAKRRRDREKYGC